MDLATAFRTLGIEPTDDPAAVDAAFADGPRSRERARARDTVLTALRAGAALALGPLSVPALAPPPPPPTPPSAPPPAPLQAPPLPAGARPAWPPAPGDDPLAPSGRRAARWLRAAIGVAGLVLLVFVRPGQATTAGESFDVALGVVRKPGMPWAAVLLFLVMLGGAIRWALYRIRARREGRTEGGRLSEAASFAMAAAIVVALAGFGVLGHAENRWQADPDCEFGGDCLLVAESKAAAGRAYRLMAASAVAQIGASALGLYALRVAGASGRPDP